MGPALGTPVESDSWIEADLSLTFQKRIELCFLNLNVHRFPKKAGDMQQSVTLSLRETNLVRGLCQGLDLCFDPSGLAHGCALYFGVRAVMTSAGNGA